MSDIKCPYCDHEQEVCHDDGENIGEGETHQMECYECEKTFVFNTSISFFYEPAKADCLNGKDHKFKAIVTYPKELTKMRCIDCDEIRACTEDEMTVVLANNLQVL